MIDSVRVFAIATAPALVLPAAGGFATGSAGNAIQSVFYGPNHREAGGVFERGRVFGAFGAKRQ